MDFPKQTDAGGIDPAASRVVPIRARPNRDGARVMRSLLTVISALSLSICICSCAVWPASFFWDLDFSYMPEPKGYYAKDSSDPSLLPFWRPFNVHIYDVKFTGGRVTYHHSEHDISGRLARWRFEVSISEGVASNQFSFILKTDDLSFPLWFVTGVFAILPAYTLVSRIFKKRRVRGLVSATQDKRGDKDIY